jgi:hypothetical protein
MLNLIHFFYIYIQPQPQPKPLPYKLKPLKKPQPQPQPQPEDKGFLDKINEQYEIFLNMVRESLLNQERVETLEFIYWYVLIPLLVIGFVYALYYHFIKDAKYRRVLFYRQYKDTLLVLSVLSFFFALPELIFGGVEDPLPPILEVFSHIFAVTAYYVIEIRKWYAKEILHKTLAVDGINLTQENFQLVAAFAYYVFIYYIWKEIHLEPFQYLYSKIHRKLYIENICYRVIYNIYCFVYDGLDDYLEKIFYPKREKTPLEKWLENKKEKIKKIYGIGIPKSSRSDSKKSD